MSCQVCGVKLIDEIDIGHICSCCGYEYGCDDYITIEEIYFCKRYSDIISKSLKERISQLNQSIEKSVPKDIAIEILRIIWIKNGYMWSFNTYNEKSIQWGIESAKEQLKNIDVDINDYL